MSVEPAPVKVGRRAALSATLASGIAVSSLMACSPEGPPPAAATNGARTDQERANERLIRDAFARGVAGPELFYSVLSDDVQWTIATAEPRTYTSKAQFLAEGAAPITDRLEGAIQADVRELITEGDTVFAYWTGTATALDGRPYVNAYSWFMRVRDERVVHVVASLDFVAINELIERVSLPR